MSGKGGPPRLAEALLSLCLPPGGYRESVLGDMEEAWRRRRERSERAAWWYWSRALRIAAGYAARRIAGRRRYPSLERGGTPTERRWDGMRGRTPTEGRGDVMGDVLTDLRFAIRWYRRAPGFLAVALATLALAIGANTAVFSVVDAVYLEPLPFHRPEALVRVGLSRLDQPGSLGVHTAGDFREWRDGTTSFSAMAAWAYRTVTVERGGTAERLTAAVSVGSLFEVLGRDAARGRTFTDAEEGPGAENLAVLSDGYAERLFGDGDPVGETLRIGGAVHTVIGVMPPDFAYPSGVELWVTAPFDAETLAARNDYFLRTVARLREGADVDDARRELESIAASTRERLPETYQGIGVAVEPMQEWLRAGAGSLWWVLMTSVTLVLLIGCVNLANLLLSRGTNRRAELAVRKALGAGEGRLVRQAFTESLVLALAGGALGVLAGTLFLDLLLRWMPGGVPRAETVSIDAGVLAFTLAVSVVAGLLFGTLPALRVRREAVGARLRSSRSSETATGALIAVEVALALVLLAAAGLTTRSFGALLAQDPGIVVDDLAVLQVPASADRPAGERHAVHRALEARVAALPGVRSVGMVSTLPVVDFTPGAWVNEPGAAPEGGDRPGAKYQVVSPGYFEAAGVELLRGRPLTRRDGVDGDRAVLVSRSAAEELFPGEDPLGKRFDLGLDGDLAPLSTVVGVVGDVRLNGLDEPAPGAVYAVQELMPWWDDFHLLVRLEQGAPVPADLRETVLAVDPDLPWLGVRRMDEVVADALGGRRDTMLLFGLLGVVALALAAVGVFGVLAYQVGRRTREMGIRLAVGAAPGAVRARVLRRGMAPVVAGLAAGVLATAALGRFMESLVFGVEPLDAPSLLAVSSLLAVVAAAAIWLPARRASRVDVVRVLQGD